MWADTLLSAEKQHLARLLMWGALTVLAGTLVLVLLLVRRVHSPLLRHFAIQTAAWGAIIAVVAVIGAQNVALRDVAGAARLERFVWMNIGLDAGYAGIGATLAIAGHRMGRHMAAVGAGLGIVLQGLALLLLDLQFAVLVSR